MENQKVSGEKARRSAFRKRKKAFLEKCSGRLNGRMPKSEQWFREKLEDYGLYNRFKKNTPLYKLGLIPDLHNRDYKIVIEVDGSIHETQKVKARDAEKDEMYKKAGYTVFRVVHNDEEGAYRVLDELVEMFKKPSPRQLTKTKRRILAGKVSPAPINEQLRAIKAILGSSK